MKFRTLTGAGRAILALGAICFTVGAASIGAGGARAAAPPYEPDPNANGTLTFYNSSGAVITSGSTTAKPFASYLQASAAGHASGDTKATLFGYLPKSGQATGAFAGEQMTASTTYPVANAPAPLNSSPLPLVAVTAADESIGELAANFPNTATDAYQGLYQLRVKTSGTGQSAGATYEATDIFISGTTWTQVYPAPGAPPTTTTTTPGVTTTTTPGVTTTTAPGATTTTTRAPTTTTTVAPTTTTTGAQNTTTTVHTTTTGGSAATTTTVASSATLVVKNASGSTLTGNPTLTPGQSLTITDTGFAAGETVTITANSTPQTLATVAATSTGAVSATVVVPTNLAAGSHTIVVAGTSKSDTFAFQIAAATLPRTGFGASSSLLFGGGALLLVGGALLTVDRRRALGAHALSPRRR